MYDSEQSWLDKEEQKTMKCYVLVLVPDVLNWFKFLKS